VTAVQSAPFATDDGFEETREASRPSGRIAGEEIAVRNRIGFSNHLLAPSALIPTVAALPPAT
jgi:hypothetical protein